MRMDLKHFHRLAHILHDFCNFSFVLYLNFQEQQEETKWTKGAMTSDASHALEAALEQMDGIIAGKLRGS